MTLMEIKILKYCPFWTLQNKTLNSSENKNKLEGKLTEKEILTDLKKMKNNKNPGIDGFTSEFFFFFNFSIQILKVS